MFPHDAGLYATPCYAYYIGAIYDGDSYHLQMLYSCNDDWDRFRFRYNHESRKYETREELEAEFNRIMTLIDKGGTVWISESRNSK